VADDEDASRPREPTVDARARERSVADDEDASRPRHGVRLVVAYDGTDFAGFQAQPGQRTVQGELERAIAQMAGHPVRLRVASRTDSGVHALGQVVAFDARRALPERGWKLGLHAHLPPDIRVQHAASCAPGYQPRFDATGKLYRYLIQSGEATNPLLRHRAWQLAGAGTPDVGRMRAAAALLAGSHDFRAFRQADDERESTLRTLWRIDVLEKFGEDPSLIAIEVEGNAFMKNMVRILAGTLVDVGLRRIPLEGVPRMLGPEARREWAGQTAPARGLVLVAVRLGRVGAATRA
jgi:tRNA pseudouridine38-40 synthase